MDAFTLAAKLQLDSKGFEKDLTKQEGVLKKFSNKVGDALKNVGKVGGAALTGALASVGALTTAAVKAYGEYEQLVGGVETLFKESADQVQKYADSAYKTAGLSANEYMSTVTSFSASLLQGLNGDTAKAAQIADKAIIDMADNANKMGTTIDRIQDAYSGFAKANFTMLDNLKLGYGGTKTEMERLLVDAEKLTGIKYDINNFADIIEAIHVIQVELGITGTTAKEADQTIQGSFSAMKSAWENLVIEFGKGNGDIQGKIGILVDTAETAFNNLMPVVENAISGIATFVEAIAPIISKKLPGIISDIGPKLINAAAILASGVVSALPSLIDTIFTAITSADWVGIGQKAWEMISSAFQGTKEWATKTFNSVVEAIGNIDWPQVGHDILDKLGSGLAAIADWFRDKFSAATEGLKSINWKQAGADILTSIGTAFATITSWFKEQFSPGPDGISQVDWKGAGKSILDFIKTAFNGISDFFKGVFETGVSGIAKVDWKTAGSNILTAIGNGISDIANWFKEKFKSASTGIAQIDWKTIGSNILTAIGNAFTGIADWFKEKFKDASTGIAKVDWETVGSNILTTIGNAFSAISDWFKEKFSAASTGIAKVDWNQVGLNILTAIGNGFSDIVNWATDLFNDAAKAIKAISWYDVGTFIRDKIEYGISWIKTNILSPFNAAIDSVKALKWQELGESISGFIEAGLAGIDQIFAGLFGEGWESFKSTAGELEPILAGIGGALLTIKAGLAISDAIKKVGDGFSGLIGIFTGHPILTIAGIIAGVGAALWDLYNTSEEFRDKVDRVWAGIKNVAKLQFDGVKTAITTAIESVKSVWNNVRVFFTETIPQEWEKFSSKAQAFFTPIKNVIDGAIRVIQTVWNAVVGLFTTDIPGAWSQLNTDAGEYFGLIESVIKVAIGGIESIWNGVSNFFTTDIPSAWETVKSKASDVFGTVKEKMSGALSWVNGLIDGIANLLGLNADKTITVTTEYRTVGTPNNEAEQAITGSKGKTNLPSLGAPTASAPATLKKGAGVMGTELVTIDAFGNLNKFASAMSGGTILRGATIFGAADGSYLMGGEAGMEAVVGVGSLKEQIRNAVREGLSGIAANIASAMQGGNQKPIYVVLDTGELVGAIGRKMDAELGRLGNWKSGGAA